MKKKTGLFLYFAFYILGAVSLSATLMLGLLALLRVLQPLPFVLTAFSFPVFAVLCIVIRKKKDNAPKATDKAKPAKKVKAEDNLSEQKEEITENAAVSKTRKSQQSEKAGSESKTEAANTVKEHSTSDSVPENTQKNQGQLPTGEKPL